MIYIENVNGAYRGSVSPPDAHVDYRAPELMSGAELAEEFRKRGVAAAAIRQAFVAADKEASVNR